MLNKPFRTPLLTRPPVTQNHNSRINENGPPVKKRRISADEIGRNPHEATLKTSQPHRSPLIVQESSPAAPAKVITGNGTGTYHNILWRKFTTKKHKTWDGDGVLSVNNGYAYLQDESGREMGKTVCTKPLEPGSMLSIGGKEVEIESSLSREEYLAKRPHALSKPTIRELEKRLQTSVRFNSKYNIDDDVQAEKPIKPLNFTATKSSATNLHFKNPVMDKTVFPKKDGQNPTPRHDPSQPHALVMKRPSSAPKGKQIVDVVVDPVLCKHLREHQREGVKFMYECLMGMRPHGGEGAILADEMGFGKTLQVIALLWTLLKQNPTYDDGPTIKKALIVCPVSLIRNWRKEFRKWLGNERIGVFVADDKKAKMTDFTMGRSYSIMIIGYEKLRTVQDELQKGVGIDIVVADEGHRLKTAQNKSAQAIKSLSTEKRIILSGTPLQNDLSEFYFMVDFVSPGLLGKPSGFRREFENPIIKSRQPGASAKDVEKGEAKSAELAQLTGPLILRRTAEILSKYLPPKTEYVLFCRPTSAQASVYRSVLLSPIFNAVLNSPETSLQLINILKKLCNSPSLIRAKDEPEDRNSSVLSSLLSGISPALLASPGSSAKLQVLDQFLHTLRCTTQEKVVIVSHYTSTLDILGNLLNSLSYTWQRLDGSTPAAKRQGLVDRFNRTDAAQCFAFLLSAKSGGAGLNLIGASRLILFDVDWNPSTDLQAMARIHRDGQKRPCKIYRLMTKGALDEKIYQRQLTKQSLADSVVDNKVSASTFTREELQDLFTLDESDGCQTHELLKCQCDGRGEAIIPKDNLPLPLSEACGDDDDLPAFPALLRASQVDMEAQERQIRELVKNAAVKDLSTKILSLMQYLHIDTSKLADGEEEVEGLVDDDVLLDVLKHKENRVSFVFSKTS